MATSLLEYLTQPNPVVDNSNSLKGLPTKCVPKEDIQVVDWDDFTYETLISCYGAILATRFNRPFPEISPPLRRIEGEIIDEDSLDHLLTRSITSIVNESLRIAWRAFYSDYPNLAIDMTRGGRARASQNNPDVPRPPHDRQQASSASTDHTPVFPDWAGVQADLGPVSHLNRCPGDTKLSSKWQSDTDTDKEYHDWPYAQLIKYCGETWNIRYGYLITDKELVVLRISRAMIPSGIANKRSPRNVASQPSRPTGQDSPLFVSSSPPSIRSSPACQGHLRNISASSVASAMSIDQPSSRPRQLSIAASFSSLSMSEASEHAPGSERMSSSAHMPSSQSYRDDGRGGEYRPVEMKSVSWNDSGKGKLTVKLALWWIHMMAAAPGCDTTIGPEYPHMDSWVPRPHEGGYRHTTTGLLSKKLPKNSKEISPRRAAQGIVIPPHQRQPSGSPPAEHLSSPNQPSPQYPTKEEITGMCWIPERSRWQYRTRRGSVGLIRNGVPIRSSDGGYYYIRRTREGGSQWVRAESEEEEDEEEDEDDDSDENESSRYLPPASSKYRRY
ncbi:hypothetical protein A7D00_3445 [Trichophyton violaceum]|uniref:Uncharacterized protein n=1 Tax=Trichophyton violaceum TaxID=34388 RepID=A0A178FKP1_TRIVO|nr:hypothetical protein A7D00_3445 [Trichophyton violaceum]